MSISTFDVESHPAKSSEINSFSCPVTLGNWNYFEKTAHMFSFIEMDDCSLRGVVLGNKESSVSVYQAKSSVIADNVKFLVVLCLIFINLETMMLALLNSQALMLIFSRNYFVSSVRVRVEVEVPRTGETLSLHNN